MNELLQSLKADLTDRRMLPLLALLGVALVGAIAYAVVGGGSGASAPPVASAPVNVGPKGANLAVSEAGANPNAALSETTDGHGYRHQSGTRSPFASLNPPKKPAKASSSSSSSSSSSGAGGGSGSTGKGAGGAAVPSVPSTPGGEEPETPPVGATPAEPTKPKKHKQEKQPVYVVEAQFGVSSSVAGAPSQLTPYPNLKRMQPLPSAEDAKVVYTGVDAADEAVFTIAGEAILKGEGKCMPSATQCEAIALTAGHEEEFGYLEASGATTDYELKVVSIVRQQASAARAASLEQRDRAGTALVNRLAPSLLDDLHFSARRGVLVFAAPHRRRHR